MFEVETYGDRSSFVPGSSQVARHPLLEAAIDAYPPPKDVALEVSVRSVVPAGCGTGTSAAVAVALLGALAAVRSEHPSRRQVAYRAHRLEVDLLGAQSGIQDQLSVAFGGINYLEIETYPRRRCTPNRPGGSSAPVSRWSSSVVPTTPRRYTARSSRMKDATVRGRCRGCEMRRSWPATLSWPGISPPSVRP